MNRSEEVRGGPKRSGEVRGGPSLALLLASGLTILAVPTSAAADILVFKTGRTMSVAGARVDGDRMVIALRGGGEGSFPLSMVERVDPDEVPYPVPAVADAETPATPADPQDAVLASRPFAELIASAAATHGVDVRLVHAVIEAESNYRPRARSRKGAKGLMQLMPATARQYAVKDPYDPKANIEAGVKHLKDLLTRFDVTLALAAYNAGEATIRRYRGLPPFAETRGYVARILTRLGR